MKCKLILLFYLINFLNYYQISAQKVHTSYLWHMDQPVYWADKSKDKPESKQFVEESNRLKNNGTNIYPGSPVAHPTNNLEEIFSKADRVQAYQSSPRNAINSMRDIPNAGAQLSISGGLLDNIQSLGAKNQWGYSANWMNSYKEANGWKTSGNFTRLDIVNFTYDHAFSPFVSERALVRQIKAFQYVSSKYYGYNSKGYWPAECAFSERIIQSLVSCGIEWSVVPNSHLARTLSDYVHPYNINGNIDAPNRADKVPTQGINWYSGTIDGRGSTLAAPYCYQAHKAQYINPATGVAYKIDIIPMCNYISYIDGYSGANTSDISSKIEPFSSSSQPSIVLLAHDGDNAWGGGSSYYNEAVNSFSHAANAAGYEPVTIQQFLNDHPVPASDIVKVEDGAWVNADSDWGHPQFINWMWPLFSKTDYRFNPDSWTEDARNWAVITATDNYVTMAEDLEGGTLRNQYIAEGGTSATNAEKAWHFYFGGLNSGFMYYGKAEDMEVKPSMTGNIAIEYAQKVIDSKLGVDNTAPSVFIPQRYPYNPGEFTFGPTTAYKKVATSSDFHVWTFAYDVSGLSKVELKYRLDKDGDNSLSNNDNEIYNGGSEVEAWQTIDMNRRPMSSDPTTDSELNFFILPKAKADLCYAEILGLKDKLVDYYVEATDSKGNVYRSPIQHVYVGLGDGQTGGGGSVVSWEPKEPSNASIIRISCTNATASSKLHWGVNATSGGWVKPIAAYFSPTTVSAGSTSVETPFTLIDGKWQVVLGPFNNPAQAVSSVNFVINHGSNNWDNNNGSDYTIKLSSVSSDNPISQNFTKTLNQNESCVFTLSDFGFSSPKGNQFKAIKILSLPETGVLKLNGTNTFVGQLITNPTELIYFAALLNSSFSFKIIDNQDLESDANYTVSFVVKNPNISGITLSFKKPIEWGSSGVSIWAWNSNGNIFSSWPGVAMTDNGNAWYSYTFEPSISTVNVIFSKNGNPQTVDINAVTQSTCFQQNGLNGTKLTVATTDCSTTALMPVKAKIGMLVFPQPATTKARIELANIDDLSNNTLILCNLNGSVVLMKSFSGSSFILEKNELKSGFYLLNILTKNGMQFKSKIAFK